MTCTALYTDLRGLLSHVKLSDSGEDGNSIAFGGATHIGWGSATHTDYFLLATGDRTTDPFTERDVVFCDVSADGSSPFELCPRSVLRAAEHTALARLDADQCVIGMELEFHILDAYNYRVTPQDWTVRASGTELGNVNIRESGGRILHETQRAAFGHFDRHAALREAIAEMMLARGVHVKGHSHESGRDQHEISFQCLGAVTAADTLQLVKSTIRRAVAAAGKVACFLPHPLPFDFGSGLHLNMSFSSAGRNLFARPDGSASASCMAFAQNLASNAPAIAMLATPTANSYQRLFRAFDLMRAPQVGNCDRHCMVRLPATTSPAFRRAEARFPDATMNAYLGLAAVLLAGVTQGHAYGETSSADNDRVAAMERAGRIPFDASSLPAAGYPTHLADAIRRFGKDGGFLTDAGPFSHLLQRRLIGMANGLLIQSYLLPDAAELNTTFLL